MARTAAANVAVPVATVLTGPVLAHALGVLGRGQVAAATAPVLLLTTVATFGLPDALLYHAARHERLDPRVLRRALAALLVTGVLGSVVCLLVAPLLAPGDPHLARLISIAGTAAPFSLLAAGCRGVSAGSRDWRSVTREQYVTALTRVLLLVGLLVAGALTVLPAALVLAFSPAAGLLAYANVARRVRRPLPEAEAVSGRRLATYGLTTWVGALSGTVLSRLDQVLMTPLSSAGQLGLYAAGVNLADLLLVANNAIRDVTFAADARQAVNAHVVRSCQLALTLALALGGLLAATSPVLVVLLFGRDFASAVPSACVLVAAAVIGAPTAVAGAALSARGRPGLRSLALLAAACVNVLLLVLLVPGRGSLGAALATLGGNAVAAVSGSVLLRRETGISPLSCYRPNPALLRTAVLQAAGLLAARRRPRDDAGQVTP
ncbi:MAG: oligosaccharide flippase family protein [Nocardioidaceae bacterium]